MSTPDNTNFKGSRPTTRIGIYLCDAQNYRVGIGEVERSLGQALANRSCELRDKHGVELVFFVSPEMAGFFGPDVEYIPLTKKIARRAHCPLFYRSFRKKWDLDLIHWTHQTPKLLRRAFSPKTLMTIHDINFIHNRNNWLQLCKKKLRMRRRLSQATHLTFISEFSHSDVAKNFPVDIPYWIIHNGVTDQRAVEQEPMNLAPGYLFFIATIGIKKNVDKLVRMMQYLPAERLVVSGGGKPQLVRELRELAESLSLSNVTFTGPVSPGNKAWLLENCKALCFPSQSEGFGLPVIEAMQWGKPVFLSPFTALPEIGGPEAYYFEPDLRPEDMAATVAQGLSEFTPDKAVAIRANAARFVWSHAADLYIQAYLRLLELNC